MDAVADAGNEWIFPELTEPRWSGVQYIAVQDMAAPAHEVDNLAMAISLVASTHGVALLPAYARNFLPRSVTSRPLRGNAPTIDLVVGYSRANTSPILRLFLSRLDDLIARVSGGGRQAFGGA